MKNLKIIRPKELSKLLGISVVSIWRLEKRGELPPRIKLSQRAVGWLESDIEEWLDSRPNSSVTSTGENS